MARYHESGVGLKHCGSECECYPVVEMGLIEYEEGCHAESHSGPELHALQAFEPQLCKGIPRQNTCDKESYGSEGIYIAPQGEVCHRGIVAERCEGYDRGGHYQEQGYDRNEVVHRSRVMVYGSVYEVYVFTMALHVVLFAYDAFHRLRILLQRAV